MKKLRKIVLIPGFSLILITLLISVANRVIYGTFDVFSYPRIVGLGINNHVYYNEGRVVKLTSSEIPMYEVSTLIDKFTGKRIYSKDLDYTGNGKTVYLHLDGDRYLVFKSDGGV